MYNRNAVTAVILAVLVWIAGVNAAESIAVIIKAKGSVLVLSTGSAAWINAKQGQVLVSGAPPL